jgi:hypothetical protein
MEVRGGKDRSRRPLLRVAVAAVGLLITVITAGCGGSDEQSPKAQATSEPTVAANIELPGGRIPFRRFLDDAQTHGAISLSTSMGATKGSSPIRPLGMSTSTPTGRRRQADRLRALCGGQAVPGLHRRLRRRLSTEGGSALRAEADLRPRESGMDTRRATRRHSRPGPRTLRSTTGENWIQQSAVELLDLDNGRQRTILERRDWTGDASTPAVSPDGRTVSTFA